MPPREIGQRNVFKPEFGAAPVQLRPAGQEGGVHRGNAGTEPSGVSGEYGGGKSGSGVGETTLAGAAGNAGTGPLLLVLLLLPLPVSPPGSVERSACGSVARFAAADSRGRNSGPFCPQPQSASKASKALPAASSGGNRIFSCLKLFDMGEILMTDSEFLDRAEALLRAIESECDRLNDATEADIDNQRVGGMVTLTFGNGSQIVINLQKPLHEVWLAAQSGGYHYHFDAGRWIDTRGAGEFLAQLSRDASAQSGLALEFGGAPGVNS